MKPDPLKSPESAPHQASAKPRLGPATEGPEPAGGAPARPENIREGAWGARHAINLRVSIPFGFRRYYVTVVAGRERRSAARRSAERRLHPLVTFGNIALCAGCGMLVGLAGLALIQLALSFVLQQTGSLVITP